ncbi:hypothetical protein Tco_1468498 [Tanacetum coccineum]
MNVQPTTELITPTTTIHVEENNDDQAANARFGSYEFINPFCTPVQEVVESFIGMTRKLYFIFHWANPFKDFEWSNVPGVKLSSFSESDDTFMR